MSRVTSSHFIKAVDSLEDCIGIPLTCNIWDRHFSVYTKGVNDSCQELIASSNTARDAVDQIVAAKNALYIYKKSLKELES